MNKKNKFIACFLLFTALLVGMQPKSVKAELSAGERMEVTQQEKNKTLLWGSVTIGLVAVGIYVGTKDRNRKREKEEQTNGVNQNIEKKKEEL